MENEHTLPNNDHDALFSTSIPDSYWHLRLNFYYSHIILAWNGHIFTLGVSSCVFCTPGPTAVPLRVACGFSVL